jgi:hypothetical protein
MINRVYIPASLSLNIDGTVHLKGDRELMQSYFRELMKQDPKVDVEICITRIDSKKTNPQLAYFYSTLVPIIRGGFEALTGEVYTKEEIVTYLKDKYFYEEIMFQGQFIKTPLSLSKGKKEEVHKFIQDVITFAREILGVEVPELN